MHHAVWDLLCRLGHRQFFPGETWEVVPRLDTVSIEVDVVEKPDYLSRMIWANYGSWDYNVEPNKLWQMRNRAPGAFALKTGHAYDSFIHRNKSVFDQHPEYLGLVKGERRSSKLCISNPDLRQLVVDHCLRAAEQNPDHDSVSVDPSDGGGWCECEPCAAIGTPSDRALLLANDAAAAMEQKFPDKYVAMYAYNYHAPPPTQVAAHPRVSVSVATAFLRGQTVDGLIDGWKAKGIKQFGIREYFSINTWDRDLPGRARASDFDYLATTIPHYHAQGAKFYSAESGDNWGPCGLGYYLAARIMWDVDEAKRVEELKTDFFQKAFGAAEGPMREFYHRILRSPSRPVLMSRDLTGRMYRLLDEARSQTSDPKIHARLDHLVLYTRYVELFRAYEMAGGDARQQAFERLIRHAYRIRTTQMVHAKAIYRDLDNRDKSVAIPDEAKWQKPEPDNPWKSSASWTAEEIAQLSKDGIASNPTVSFTPQAFSQDLRPLDAQLAGDPRRLEDSYRSRGRQIYYTWASEPNTKLPLQVTGGLIEHYRDRGPARVEVMRLAGGKETIVGQGESAPDGQMRLIEITLPESGLYKIVISDGMDQTEVRFPPGVHRTIEANLSFSQRHGGRRSGYFLVPKGTKVVGGYAAAAGGAVFNADGEPVYEMKDGSDYFEVPVSEGQDGRLWSLRDVPGAVMLLTVPPYLAEHPRELLVPAECVP